MRGKAVLNGFLAALFLLWLYFGLVTFVSGFDFAKNQFFQFWYYILGLALGFSVQFSQYQIQFFWLGLAANLAGIAYILKKIVVFKKVDRNLKADKLG